MTAHTPGPWRAHIHKTTKHVTYCFVEAKGVSVATVHHPEDVHVLAAAPELLEALEYLVGAHEHPWATAHGSPRGVLDHVPPALEKAHAAIAKARCISPTALPMLAGEGR